MDQASCSHPVGWLREAPTFPEKYVVCTKCSKAFRLEKIICCERDNWGDRFRAMIPIMAGCSTDETPLKDFIAKGMTLDDC